MLGGGVVVTTGLPGPVELLRLTSADAPAFADHVARDRARLHAGRRRDRRRARA
jgi:hypothetical protein